MESEENIEKGVAVIQEMVRRYVASTDKKERRSLKLYIQIRCEDLITEGGDLVRNRISNILSGTGITLTIPYNPESK